MHRPTALLGLLGLLLSSSVALAAEPSGTDASAADQPPNETGDDGDVFDSLASDLEQGKESESPSAASTPTPTGAQGSQSLNPDISVIADFAAAGFSDTDNLQTGGHDPIHNGFNLQ